MKRSGTTYKKALIAIAFLAASLVGQDSARAVGTAAGTVIMNTVSVNYTIAGNNYSQSSNASLRIAERLELTLTLQDASPVPVLPGQANAVSTLRITNTGNGNDAYTLSATGAGIGGDQFDPVVTAIYFDANGNGVFDQSTDVLYSSGTGTVTADGFLTIFVLSSIPATTMTNGDVGTVNLTAVSASGTGPAGTILPGAGEGGSDAVIGASQGTRTAAGSYAISSGATVNVTKTAVILDPYGGNRPQPGATIRYTLSVTMAGTGTAIGIVISDAIPASTTYKPGTIVLNGVPLTDATDADAGNFGITSPNTITVNVGNLTSASPAQVISFDVKID